MFFRVKVYLTVAKDFRQFKKALHTPTVVILILFVLGTFLSVDVREYVKGMSARNWKSVEGVILNRTVDLVKVGSSTVLDMKCEYQYRDRGVIHIGKTVKFQSKPVFNGGIIQAFENKYNIGDKVKVYFDYAHPGDSCLEPGASLFQPILNLFIYTLLALIIYLSAYPKIAITQSESKVFE